MFDVDGVLTDGSLFIGDDGQEYKAFNSRTDMAWSCCRRRRADCIITGRTSGWCAFAWPAWGSSTCIQGKRENSRPTKELKSQTGLNDQQIAYVGDDVVDLPVMTRVGLAIAVQDAHALTKQHAHWVTASGGGRGARAMPVN